MSPAPIAEVETIVLRAPTVDPDGLDGAAETVVVRITDADGLTGIGEADAPPELIRDLVQMADSHAWSRGLRSMLLGRDPFPIGALWHELYEGTIYHGRRGLGLHALSAVDVALHDLVGRQLDRPVYELLGGARRSRVTPYATVYAGPVKGRTIAQMMDVTSGLLERAVSAGYRAVKMEVLFEDLVGDRELVTCIHEGRSVLGDGVTMMIDFGYRWHDWRDAFWTLSRVEDCDVFFAEAALQHDDLEGHRKLAERVGMRIGGAEFAATVHECREWLERGRVDVLQPNIGRCGGLTEIRRIAELAGLHSAVVCPHGWKTGITAAVSRHFQAATPNSPYVEVIPAGLYDSPLREELTRPEPVIENGSLPLPDGPGLGIELVVDVVERYRC